MAVCKAVDLAHYIVDKCTRDDEPVSNLQLQKMMYFLQSVYCKTHGGDLLFDDEFQAWPYGPVLPELYREYSIYGGSSILERRDDIPHGFLRSHKGWVDEGIKFLRSQSPWDLVNIAHAPGSPWSRVWDGGSGYKDTIPNEMIIESAKAVR